MAGFRNRIADPKLGEKRFAAQIFKREGLLAAELAAQAALPVQRRQIGGGGGGGAEGVRCSAWSRNPDLGVWISSKLFRSAKVSRERLICIRDLPVTLGNPRRQHPAP